MKTLLLDIETAPHRVYAWGLWDQNIALNQIEEVGYTICWAAKWYGEKEMMFRGLNTHSNTDRVQGAYDLINEADAVVHYNGTRFDMPTLNREFVLHGFPRPASYKQIDLLRTVRRQFKLPSNKLQYVSEFLGYGGKMEHKGMDLWRECMQGDKDAWDIMEEYNKKDVELLERVYVHLLPWIDNHPNVGLYQDDVAPVCPKCGSRFLLRRGFAHTTTMTYQRYRCNSCGGWMRNRVNVLEKEKKANLLVEHK